MAFEKAAVEPGYACPTAPHPPLIRISSGQCVNRAQKEFPVGEIPFASLDPAVTLKARGSPAGRAPGFAPGLLILAGGS
jgi:hypothetical protein